jgi:uncharacterized damage-inducible protein DinB
MPTISEDLLVGFDQEMSNTRKLLECLPDGNFDFRPHEKSMALGTLAGHIAALPRWARYVLEYDTRNLAPPDGQPQFVRFLPANREETLATFDSLAKEARALIGKASDGELQRPWSMLFAQKTVFTMPRWQVLRLWFLNHFIHHRAQLGVYLRLLNIPIPGMYGPSADTQAQLRAQLES